MRRWRGGGFPKKLTSVGIFFKEIDRPSQNEEVIEETTDNERNLQEESYT